MHYLYSHNAPVTLATEFWDWVFSCFPPCVRLALTALMQSCRCWLLKVWFVDQQHPYLLGFGRKAGSPAPPTPTDLESALPRSLMILMPVKVWETMDYNTMMNSLTDHNSLFYSFRNNQQEERSKPVTSLGERGGREKEACLGKEI